MIQVPHLLKHRNLYSNRQTCSGSVDNIMYNCRLLTAFDFLLFNVSVCNYIAHESCLKKPGISPCHSLAASLIKVGNTHIYIHIFKICRK